MIDARESHFAHLTLKLTTVAAWQSMLVKPRMHHLMEQCRLDLFCMACEQQWRQLDNGWAVTDATGDRRQAWIKNDSVSAKHAAKVLYIEHRENNLKIRCGWKR